MYHQCIIIRRQWSYPDGTQQLTDYFNRLKLQDKTAPTLFSGMFLQNSYRYNGILPLWSEKCKSNYRFEFYNTMIDELGLEPYLTKCYHSKSHSMNVETGRHGSSLQFTQHILPSLYGPRCPRTAGSIAGDIIPR